MKKIYFCGIGGAGMSPLARLMAARGYDVLGSDRGYDLGRNKALFNLLKTEGITLVPQDGSGVDASIDTFVVTRAVETSVPDISRALEFGLPVLKRPRFMAEVFKDTDNIAVGGTSGKSTTTGMIGHILAVVGRDPTVMNGAVMINSNSNFMRGASRLAVFEADESDGFEDVISVCPAAIAVVTNISLDHFELEELKEMFSAFLMKARVGAVLNADCPNSMELKGVHPKTITFGASPSADFSLSRIDPKLSIPGEHNQVNAIAAVATCSLLGISVEDSLRALQSFRGIKRRLELVGEANGIRVIDDFASNPGKLGASLRVAIQNSKRVFVIFQPHGFQPTKMMKDGYIETFASTLRSSDVLIMPDIFYVGGSVNLVNGEVVTLPKDISSRDVTEPVSLRGKEAHHIPNRADILPFLAARCQPGDTVLIMGSRDESLSDFAQEVAALLARRAAS
jgi:UDP-N-acetylmuramate--alanine ligase